MNDELIKCRRRLNTGSGSNGAAEITAGSAPPLTAITERDDATGSAVSDQYRIHASLPNRYLGIVRCKCPAWSAYQPFRREVWAAFVSCDARTDSLQDTVGWGWHGSAGAFPAWHRWRRRSSATRSAGNQVTVGGVLKVSTGSSRECHRRGGRGIPGPGRRP